MIHRFSYLDKITSTQNYGNVPHLYPESVRSSRRPSSPRPIAAPRKSLQPPPKSVVQERLEAENKSLQEDLSRLRERMDAMEMSLRDTQPPIVKRYVDSLGRIKELETVSEFVCERL